MAEELGLEKYFGSLPGGKVQVIDKVKDQLAGEKYEDVKLTSEQEQHLKKVYSELIRNTAVAFSQKNNNYIESVLTFLLDDWSVENNKKLDFLVNLFYFASEDEAQKIREGLPKNILKQLELHIEERRLGLRKSAVRLQSVKERKIDPKIQQILALSKSLGLKTEQAIEGNMGALEDLPPLKTLNIETQSSSSIETPVGEGENKKLELQTLEQEFQDAFEEVKDQKALRLKSQQFQKLSSAFFNIVNSQTEGIKDLKQDAVSIIFEKYGSSNLGNPSGSTTLLKAAIVAKILNDPRGEVLGVGTHKIKLFEDLIEVYNSKKENISQIFNYSKLDFRTVEKKTAVPIKIKAGKPKIKVKGKKTNRSSDVDETLENNFNRVWGELTKAGKITNAKFAKLEKVVIPVLTAKPNLRKFTADKLIEGTKTANLGINIAVSKIAKIGILLKVASVIPQLDKVVKEKKNLDELVELYDQEKALIKKNFSLASRTLKEGVANKAPQVSNLEKLAAKAYNKFEKNIEKIQSGDFEEKDLQAAIDSANKIHKLLATGVGGKAPYGYGKTLNMAKWFVFWLSQGTPESLRKVFSKFGYTAWNSQKQLMVQEYAKQKSLESQVASQELTKQIDDFAANYQQASGNLASLSGALKELKNKPKPVIEQKKTEKQFNISAQDKARILELGQKELFPSDKSFKGYLKVLKNTHVAGLIMGGSAYDISEFDEALFKVLDHILPDSKSPNKEEQDKIIRVRLNGKTKLPGEQDPIDAFKYLMKQWDVVEAASLKKDKKSQAMLRHNDWLTYLRSYLFVLVSKYINPQNDLKADLQIVLQYKNRQNLGNEILVDEAKKITS